MPLITFIQPDGSSLDVKVPAGISLMQAAKSGGVSGILADCGGAAICATCHVYVDEAWAGRVAPSSDHETEMLECVAAERREDSRLACQVPITEDLDGLRVRVPECQT